MKRMVTLMLGLVVLAGCPKKDAKVDGADAAPAAASAAASAAPASSDTAPAAVAANTTPEAPPADVPGVSQDPNDPPGNDYHDKQATAQIHKANYKAELDKLEKEDLSADRH